MKRISRLFKLKEGKEASWKEWCAYLMANPDLSKESMKTGNLYWEACYVYNNKFVLIEMGWLEERKPCTGDLTEKHLNKVKECLEPLAFSESLYQFEA